MVFIETVCGQQWQVEMESGDVPLIGDAVYVPHCLPESRRGECKYSSGVVVNRILWPSLTLGGGDPLMIIKLDLKLPDGHVLGPIVQSQSTTSPSAPENHEHYHPLEEPRRYPLELGKDLHICLWDVHGKFKWTIAYFIADKEGYDLHFVGDRPLDGRVDWEHFRELVVQGQQIADRRFKRRKKD